MNKPKLLNTPGLIQGIPRIWQHANANANHPEGCINFECRQVDSEGSPLGFIEMRPLKNNRVLDVEPKVFKSVSELKENWNW